MGFEVRLKELMDDGGSKSVRAFADRLNEAAKTKELDVTFPTETVRDWIDGYRKPHLETFYHLAECLGVSPIWLYDGTGPKSLDVFNEILERHSPAEHAA